MERNTTDLHLISVDLRRKPWWNQELTSHRAQEEGIKNGEQRQIRRLKLYYDI